MSDAPVEFCIHLARAVAQGQKTRTYKPLTRHEQQLRATGKPLTSPYGNVDDTLWVREPYGIVDGSIIYRASYAEDGYQGKVLLPVGMSVPAEPLSRDQARLFLTITDVSIVDLQSLVEVAAVAAGTLPSQGRSSFLEEFKFQWDANWPRQPWSTNPPVWKIDFTLNA